ncbi:YccF domain-containing protein [Facklamia sp. DSM 111018]|uniref:YccF domain-containing protein n=1 Tax=Facklamia lactis TaxID=2749967 RepID=A0ABS0LU32_9LACT|nr:YccF domain-containing protein [Facklamia lactis]MBG9980828.1 YccF domain-containing protein [Facklamia lactis]MBG9986809.1 YccF domain-containing protein [Facklamia lactis]
MSCLGNLIWFLFGGVWNGLGWLLIGVLWSLTIVGFPIGRQCFKLAKMSFFPFGKKIIYHDSSASLILNIVWLVFGGIELAMVHILSALILALTIVGIPFAKQQLKLAQLALLPFGAEIIKQ